MKRLLVAGLAVGALAAGAPGAYASHYGYAGPGCQLHPVSEATPGRDNTRYGVATVVAVPTDSAGIPTSAPVRVDCELFLNGNSQGVFLSSSSGVGVTPYSYAAEDTDVVTVCTHVHIEDEHLVTCQDAGVGQVVPPFVVDALNAVIDTLVAISSSVDPIICAVIALASPGVPGVVDISPEGDIAILSEAFFDCPPYDDPEGTQQSGRESPR